MVTQGQLPSLGHLPSPGLSRMAREWSQSDTRLEGFPAPPFPWPPPMCPWGPEAVLAPACSGPAHLFRGPETWV